MKALIKTIKDKAGEFYPVTHATAVFYKKNMTVAKKIQELEDLLANNINMNYLKNTETAQAQTGEILQYIRGVWKSKHIGGNMNVDLEIYGLKQGYPVEKPYTAADYQIAFDNMQGLNKALQEASALGYSQVTLPKGTYAFCYPYPVILPSNITLNLGGSKIKVMFESGKRSPYDSSTAAIYLLAGNLFELKGVTNAHITNGIVEGDIYERDFTDANEKAAEHTYGISIKEGTSYCSVTHLEIHGFMGDNINFTSGGKVRNAFNTGAILGSLDPTTGATIAGIVGTTTTMYTPIQNLPLPVSDYQVFSLAGQGYNRTTSLTNKYVDVYYYDKDDKFLGKLLNRKVHTPIPIARKATKYRMVFYNETDTAKNFNIFMNYGGDCHHNVVESNEIYNGHRGGITLGGSYNIIQNNNIRDNGKSDYDFAFLDGFPAFNDSTRYAINQEDSFGDNNSVCYNHISGGFHGLLLRGYSQFVDHNVFDSLSGSAIVLYDVEYAAVTNNYVQQGLTSLFGTTLPGNVIITGNWLGGGFQNQKATTYEGICSDNFILSRIESGSLRFERNTILVKQLPVGLTAGFLGSKFYKNKFIASTVTDIVVTEVLPTGMILEENEFINCNIIFNARDNAVTFKKCTFKNGKTSTTTTPNTLMIEMENCDFTDHLIEPRNGTVVDSLKFTVKNSRINFTSSYALTYLFSIVNANAVNAFTFKFSNNTVKIDNPAITSFIKYGYNYSNSVNHEIFSNSFEYTGAGVVTADLFNLTSTNNAFYSGNKLTNIALKTNLSDAKIKLYNPYKTTLAAPISGYYYLGEKVEISIPVAGGNIGWINLTEGYANDTAWVTTTPYALGARIYVGTNVYQATVAGTSGATAPSHTTGTAVDGTVTWQYMGQKAKFKSYGAIQA
ncbi:hypothetical protein [Bacillus sp. mrc49]|uniref:hypothetical protein n=1 Tax=Bacillus sp. mrc49 TaxID=2054913 RepID=UPI000C275567|nr:hypothetical protein [Bacillus sp. mrc49]PJN90996.1 hypothetical protein CVN76_07345 [Bacillus sp. mrc49]